MDRLAVILAGGASRRMGGGDKGEKRLNGKRLIDHVVECLTAQGAQLLIAGPHDYGLNIPIAPDRQDGPKGPAAGLWAALHWMSENAPHTEAFFTVPVDAPFLPETLIDDLSALKQSTIATSNDGDHPTFAKWTCASLHEALTAAEGKGLALHTLARTCRAARVSFPAQSLLNLNTPEDLAAAETLAGED